MQPGVSLREYQVADLSFLIASERSMLLHEPAGGKTPPVCVYAMYQWQENKHRTIWVMPSQLFEKNRDELLRFTEFSESEIAIVDGPKWRDSLLPGVKVFLMGAARHKLSWKEIVSVFPDINVLMGDETHMYWSTDGSGMTEALYACGRRCRYFVGMTGTLIKGRLTSAYPVIHTIEPRYYPNYQAFLNFHRELGWDGKFTWKNGDRISKIMGKHAIARSFKSIYGDEAKVIVKELCSMSAKQRTQYDEFEAKAIIELEDEFLEGKTGGVFALRCRQIMAHPETFGLGDGDTGKDKQLLIHLADHTNNGKPLVIFPMFVPEQERILKLVQSQGISCALLNGSVRPRDRARIDREFQNGVIQCVVGSPQVSTIGFNWDHCDHIIFPTIPFGDDTFYQAYRRCIRGVRSSPLLITIMEYRKSIDQRGMMMIEKKSNLAATVDEEKEVYKLSSGHQS